MSRSIVSGFCVIDEKDLHRFLKAVMRDSRLVAPQPAAGGDFLFQEVEDPERIAPRDQITSNTLKEFFFPARETVFRYQRNDDGLVRIARPRDGIKQETVFFGMHACDVRAVHFQDLFFAQEPKDSLYWRRRDQSILVSLACRKPPRATCFCVRTGGSGPVLESDEGFDLQLMNLGRHLYLVEIGTSKGERLVKEFRRFFGMAPELAQDMKRRLKASCRVGFATEYDLMRIYEKLRSANLRDLWEELGKRCTNCGGCEFICPTCYCFYTQDVETPQAAILKGIGHARLLTTLHENNAALESAAPKIWGRDSLVPPGNVIFKGERIRGWDSCTFAGYSRMAGGANPHARNADRISRRFFCKLHNSYRWFNLFSCTGCGRCSFVCPVNLDMESFLASLMKGDRYEPLLKEL